MKYIKKTKIISTIGPASCSKTKIKELINHGVNVFRFNMKHSTIEWHEEMIERVQECANELEKRVGILVDLQGPEIRIKIKEAFNVKKGEEIKFVAKLKETDDIKTVAIAHNSVIDSLDVGDRFTIDDGYIRFVVTQKGINHLFAGSLDTTVIKPNKGLNLVGKDIPLPSLIDDDIEKLHLAVRKEVDFIALSFVRSKKDVEALKKIMKEKHIVAQIVSKIESQKGIDNIDEIIEISDVIMIGRGDLGIEVPIEQLAFHQKEIIKKCRKAHKQVIVATQMLESMINNPLPTRAEATDIANAIMDGTDCIMLSGETSTGKYPVEAVAVMNKIALFNEQNIKHFHFDLTTHNKAELIVKAAQEIAKSTYDNSLKLDYIIVLTETGYTAKVVSSFRPSIPVIAVTPNSKVVEMLSMTYGVIAVQAPFPSSGKVLSPETVLDKLKKDRLLKNGEQVLLIHGQHWQKSGTTNAIVLMEIE